MADKAMTIEEATSVIKGLKTQIETKDREHTEAMKNLYVEHAKELAEWKTDPKDLIAVRKQAALDVASVNAACTKRDALIGKIEATLNDGKLEPVARLDAIGECFDEYKHG